MRIFRETLNQETPETLFEVIKLSLKMFILYRLPRMNELFYEQKRIKP